MNKYIEAVTTLVHPDEYKVKKEQPFRKLRDLPFAFLSRWSEDEKICNHVNEKKRVASVGSWERCFKALYFHNIDVFKVLATLVKLPDVDAICESIEKEYQDPI